MLGPCHVVYQPIILLWVSHFIDIVTIFFLAVWGVVRILAWVIGFPSPKAPVLKISFPIPISFLSIWSLPLLSVANFPSSHTRNLFRLVIWSFHISPLVRSQWKSHIAIKYIGYVTLYKNICPLWVPLTRAIRAERVNIWIVHLKKGHISTTVYVARTLWVISG